jgi:hypothetical protein
MRYKITRNIIALVLLVVLLTGCRSAEAKVLFKEPAYTKVDINFNIEENQSETLCYADDDLALFSVGTRNGKPEGPLYDTDHIVSYDYNNEKVINTFKIDYDGYIFSAVPYKNGVIYVDYTGALADTKWQVKFTDGDKQLVLDEGECSSYFETPSIILTNGTPVYVWQNTSYDFNRYGVNKVEDMTVSNIFTDTENKLGTVYLYGNGKEYCALIQKPDSEFGSVVVGNLDGQLFTYDLKHKLTSFGITNEKVVCALADSDRDMYIQSIDIEKQTVEDKVIYKQIYGLVGLNNNTIVYANDKDICQRDIDNFEKTEIPSTEEISGVSGLRVIYPISENKCVIEIRTGGLSKYYTMKHNG